MKEKLNNIHPGEVLLEEFLVPLNISQNKIARDICVPPRRINEICLHKRAISTDTALRLGIYFKISPEFWLNLQNMYDLEEAILTKASIYSKIHPTSHNVDNISRKKAC